MCYSIQLPILPSFTILVELCFWLAFVRSFAPLKKSGKQIHQCNNVCKQFCTKVAFARCKLYITFRLFIELPEISTQVHAQNRSSEELWCFTNCAYCEYQHFAMKITRKKNNWKTYTESMRRRNWNSMEWITL